MKKKNQFVKIDNWATVAVGSNDGIPNPYLPPELTKVSLSGKVYGHPSFRSGKSIVTSSVQDANGRKVITKNTVYKLGKIDPEFRKWLKARTPDWNWRKPVIFVRPT